MSDENAARFTDLAAQIFGPRRAVESADAHSVEIPTPDPEQSTTEEPTDPMRSLVRNLFHSKN